MKKIGVFSFLILLTGSLFAQLDEGKKMLNYERFQSAAKIFQSMLDKNPNDIEAAYWMGQTYIQNTDDVDTAAAKALYQKTLQANPNNPLLMVGVGEIELMEGKTQDARSHFEAALAATKKKDLPRIQLAVGLANVDVKAGDATYAVSVLKQAIDRDKKNPDLFMTLGDAYRKLIDGGNATTAYQDALTLDPQAARASFMIGRIYETQGITQEPIYMRFYSDAIREDPNYAPVYYWLYQYYYKRDVNKARDYLNKYVSVTDNNSKLCYAEASLLFVSNMYQQTIDKANACIAGTVGEKPFPNLFGLKAYAYDKLGDTAQSRANFIEFFEKVNPDNVGPTDYATFGKLLLLYPDKSDKADELISKAVAMDTIKQKKIEYLTDAAKSMFAKKKYAEAGKWYTRVLYQDTGFGKVDLYWAGYSNFLASRYVAADSIFSIYENKYPDDLLGWYLGAISKSGIDSTGAQGLAKPDYQKIIEIGNTISNKDSIKDRLLPAYQYMIAYFAQINKNMDSANYYNNQILVIDPANETALKNKVQFDNYFKQVNAGKAKKEDQKK